jgi:hypothetical protein
MTPSTPTWRTAALAAASAKQDVSFGVAEARRQNKEWQARVDLHRMLLPILGAVNIKEIAVGPTPIDGEADARYVDDGVVFFVGKTRKMTEDGLVIAAACPVTGCTKPREYELTNQWMQGSRASDNVFGPIRSQAELGTALQALDEWASRKTKHVCVAHYHEAKDRQRVA